ncbi:vitellogenin 3, phosvitinless [Thalassophryne amazonica]|uniref:vitellogenin 3, phosvitinless n=1 Tax=Thalassophryne amazonica TaxID=390379 RepID=UPI00147100CF|nr:vitellogenin 3, phosvitinless [Thalassophryne amazonica]
MWGLLFCCLVALATCQSLSYEPSLNIKKTYEYKYDGQVNFGLGLPNLAESGVKMQCKVKIISMSEQSFLLQIIDLAIKEFNGVPGKSDFNPSPKLTERIAAELAKPIVFNYTNGHIDEIHASADISPTVVNIVRGILGLFQVTVKTSQTIYHLEEVGVHGMCQSYYANEENNSTKELKLTRVVDVNDCKQISAVYKGMAAALLSPVSRQRGDSISTDVKYVYTIKPTNEGGVITKVRAREQQHVSPFNVKGGTFRMHTVIQMELLSELDTHGAHTIGPVKSKGNITYTFGTEEPNIPILLQEQQEPVSKAEEMLKRLAQANAYQIDSVSTEDTIKLYQLLRRISFEGLEGLWKKIINNEEERRWFLDTVSEVNDERILQFLETRFHASDITISEALQTLLLSFNHLQATSKLVDRAKKFLELPFSKSCKYLWRTVVLSYGSLVYKYCSQYYPDLSRPCPVTAVQPLLDMAAAALKNGQNEDMLLNLKALGNAGHPGSIKTIIRFIPGVAANPVNVKPHLQSTAVQALRLIAARDPHGVQDVTMQVFLKKDLAAEVRMQAILILFETKPPKALVSTVTQLLLEEENLHVSSFAYSYMKNLARSKTPENHYLSIACSVAVKELKDRFGDLSFNYSTALHMDWFNNDFLMGKAIEFFMLRNGKSAIPVEIMMKGKYNFIGRILELMELGINNNRLPELFPTNWSMNYSQAILSVIQRLNSMAQDKSFLTVYSRVFGQEWFFEDVNKEFINMVLKAVGPSAGKENILWKAIEKLQNRLSWHQTKPFLIFEARFIQPTILGLPVEISKYYQSVNGITVNAKATINPKPESLGNLLDSEYVLETDGFIGYTKDFWLYYGINTEVFQCGSELKAKMPVSIPWKLTAKVNVKENKFELDFPPCKNELELVSFSSNVYAVSRNTEDMTLDKKTPLLPNDVKDATELQKMFPNAWHPKAKTCFETNIYGAGLCMESELIRAYYNEEYPLYYVLGQTNMSIKLIPVKPEKPVEKIHFELNAAKSSPPTNVHEILQSLRQHAKVANNQLHLVPGATSSITTSSSTGHEDTETEDVTSKPEAVLHMKALAISDNQKAEGYDAELYSTPDSNSKNAQLIVSKVGEDTNWKMCIDSSLEAYSEAKAHLRWGAECQSYNVSVSAGVAHLPDLKSALMAKLHWAALPRSMEEMGERIKRCIPHMAFLLSFDQQFKKNTNQEVSALVVLTTPDSANVTVNFPECTVYQQAVKLPLQLQAGTRT